MDKEAEKKNQKKINETNTGFNRVKLFEPFAQYFAYDDNLSSNQDELRVRFYGQAIQYNQNEATIRKSRKKNKSKLFKANPNLLKAHRSTKVKLESAGLMEDFPAEQIKSSYFKFYCGGCQRKYANHTSLLIHIKTAHNNIVPSNSVLQGMPFTFEQYLKKTRYRNVRRAYRFKEQILPDKEKKEDEELDE